MRAGEGHPPGLGGGAAVRAAAAGRGKEAAAHRRAAGTGEERAAGDAAPAHDRPSAPGTRARSSERLASWAFIVSICSWVTVVLVHRSDGYSSFSWQ